MSDPLLPPLDDGPGPARPLSPAESQALVRRTLELHFQAPRRRFAPWAIAASVAFFLAASSATAAWWIGQRQPEARARTITPPPPAPPPPPPPASVTTETTAAPAPAAPLESARQLADSPEPPTRDRRLDPDPLEGRPLGRSRHRGPGPAPAPPSRPRICWPRPTPCWPKGRCERPNGATWRSPSASPVLHRRMWPGSPPPV
jgi:hypothetical protein